MISIGKNIIFFCQNDHQLGFFLAGGLRSHKDLMRHWKMATYVQYVRNPPGRAVGRLGARGTLTWVELL